MQNKKTKKHGSDPGSKNWKKYKDMAAKYDLYKHTPLILACFAEDLGAVKELLKQGCQGINTKNHYGETALMVAATKGNLELVQLLVSHKADLALLDLHGNNAAMCAFFKGHDGVVEFLVSQGSWIKPEKPAPSFFNTP